MIELIKDGATTCVDSSYNINYNGTELSEVWVCDTSNATCTLVWKTKTGDICIKISNLAWCYKAFCFCNTHYNYNLYPTGSFTCAALSNETCNFYLYYDLDDSSPACAYLCLYTDKSLGTRYCCPEYKVDVCVTNNTSSAQTTCVGASYNNSQDTVQAKVVYTCDGETFNCLITGLCTTNRGNSCTITVPAKTTCCFTFCTCADQNESITRRICIDSVSNFNEVCFKCIQEANPVNIGINLGGCTCSYNNLCLWASPRVIATAICCATLN